MVNCLNSKNCLNNVPLFDVLSDEEKSYIHQLVEQRSYKAKESIYSPGQKAASFHIIKSGKIRIYRLAENGKEQLIRVLNHGDFTGELALFKKGVYEAFAETLEDSVICSIHHEDFKKMLLNYPKVATNMLEVLANRLSTSEEQTAWVSTETVQDRLLHFIAKTAYFKKGEVLVTLNFTKKALASYLGTTPESLSREWTKLEKLGIIKTVNKTTIKIVSLDIDINNNLFKK